MTMTNYHSRCQMRDRRNTTSLWPSRRKTSTDEETMKSFLQFSCLAAQLSQQQLARMNNTSTTTTTNSPYILK